MLRTSWAVGCRLVGFSMWYNKGSLWHHKTLNRWVQTFPRWINGTRDSRSYGKSTQLGVGLPVVPKTAAETNSVGYFYLNIPIPLDRGQMKTRGITAPGYMPILVLWDGLMDGSEWKGLLLLSYLRLILKWIWFKTLHVLPRKWALI